VMAVLASRARFCSQFFLLVCRFYLRPFWSKVVLLLEKEMSVLFITLRWIFFFGNCIKVNLLTLFSNVASQ